MKRLNYLISTLVCCLLLSPSAWAQDLRPTLKAESHQLSRMVTTSDTLPARFYLLGVHVGRVNNDDQLKHWLAFFSDTRVLFWNSPAPQQAQTAMAQLEQTTVKFASQRGVQLDLPPVGFSPTVGRAAAPSAAPTEYSREGLVNLAVIADDLAGQLSKSGSAGPTLTRLSQVLTTFRSEVGAGQTRTSTVSDLVRARAGYLMTRPTGAGAEQLDLHLNMLVSALRQDPVWDALGRAKR